MATAAEVQTAYRAIVRTDLNATVAQSIADAINNGTTSLDAYIASLVTQNTTSTGAAVAITAFVTGVAPTSTQLDNLKVAADAQIASYTKLGVANPSLAAFEAFGRGLAVDSSTAAGFNTKYGSLSTADFITSVYFQVYGTNPSAAAAANLTAQINYFTTLYTQNNIPNAALAAKGAVLGQIVGYAFVSDASSVATIDNQVASFLTTAAKGDASVYGVALSAAPIAGTTFALTTGIDNLVGTANADVFNGSIDAATATNNTFTVVDSINGGAGDDSLNLLVVGVTGATTLSLANVTNVENFFVRNLDTTPDVVTLDAGQVTGEKQLWNDRSTAGVTFSNAADGTIIGIKGNASVTNSATIGGYEATAKNGAVLFNGGTLGTGNVTLTGAALETVSISSTGAANVAGTVDVAAAKTINVNAASNLTVSGISTSTAASTLNVAGAGKATLGTLDADIDIVNAASNSGGVVLTLDNDTTTKFTGGSGADVVTLGTAALVTGSVDGGAGTDTLVANGTNLNSAATGAKYTNFEVLRSAAGTVNLDNIAGITAIELNGGNVDNLSATQAAAVKVLSSGTYTVGVKGASTVGQIDTVALTVDDGLTAKNTLTLTTPVLAGVEKLSVTAVDNATITSLTGATSLTGVTLAGSGNISLTTGAVDLAANSTINGSAATGALTIDASLAQAGGTSVGLSITGGAGVDTITGTAKADVITGGAGNDILFGRNGADTLVGGDGNDTLQGDGVGVVAVAAVNEVQTLSLAAADTGAPGATDTVSVTIAGTTVTTAVVDTTDDAAVALAIKAAVEGNVTTNAAVTVSTTTDSVVFTFKTAGDATAITFNGNADAGGATEVGTVTETVKGVTAAPATISLGGDTAAADILTGGAGNDAFRFAAGSSNATATDFITDLNLGSNALAGQVDTLVFQNAGATVSIVTLAAGDQANVTAATTLAAAAGVVASVATADGATAQFTYGTDTYIFHNVDGNNTFDGAADLLIKVTGVTGTLDASDIFLI